MRGKLAEMDQLLKPIQQGSGAIIPNIATILIGGVTGGNFIIFYTISRNPY